LIYVAEIILGSSKGFASNGLTADEEQKRLELDKVIRTIYAFCTLVIWTKFLYFFRIFRSTGFYIRMLSEVAKEINHFLFILGVTIICFAHVFFIYFKNNS
jgi:hypothetical protein